MATEFLFRTDCVKFDHWKEFHSSNPQVFLLFKRYAIEALESGRKVGARMIGERIRWYSQVETAGDTSPKFNDHIWPFYVRLLIGTDERFQDFFVIKDARFEVTTAEIVNFHEHEIL